MQPGKIETAAKMDAGASDQGAARIGGGNKRNPKERLIEAAGELFCQFGINAVGVDAVIEKAGVAKTTLYKLFGSKAGLVEEVLDAEGRAWREWFAASTTNYGQTARARLNGIFPTLAQWFGEARFYGCPFINAVAEHDKKSDGVRALALGHKQKVLAYIRSLLVEAGAADPDRLAHEIALLMDGAIVTAMIMKSPEAAQVAQAALQRLLEDQLGR
jgi:AcrR family transcriptional regulator